MGVLLLERALGAKLSEHLREDLGFAAPKLRVFLTLEEVTPIPDELEPGDILRELAHGG